MTKDEVMQLAAQYGYACHECHGLPEGNADTEAYWRALDDAVRQLQAENEALRKLAEHLRSCRDCAEWDVKDCYEGRPLWDAAMK
jgi:plasmid stabilization system protein ParE